MDRSIIAFKGAYRFLSNFHPSPIQYNGLTYPTVEHAYQAAKVLDGVTRAQIRAAATAKDARRLGRAYAVRSDWDQIRVAVMEDLVRLKFTQNESLARQLLATDDARLEEGNWWGDTFWGTVDGFGENILGKILMRVRDELRECSQNQT